MRYLEERVRKNLPDVDALTATRINKGNDDIGYAKAMKDKTIHVGGPKAGIRFTRKTIIKVIIKKVKSIAD